MCINTTGEKCLWGRARHTDLPASNTDNTVFLIHKSHYTGPQPESHYRKLHLKGKFPTLHDVFR
jgi:hypothetical protein